MTKETVTTQNALGKRSPKLADDNSNNEKNQNSNNGDGYNPICSHPKPDILVPLSPIYNQGFKGQFTYEPSPAMS